MELSAPPIFAGALLAAADPPGPSVAAVVSRVIAAVPFPAAVWLGEALWLTLAVHGLAALAETQHGALL